jgi:hypothetical protein
MLLLALVAQLAMAIEGHSPLFGFFAGWGFIGSVMGPLFFFHAIAFFLPRVRTFTCGKCGWTRDYPEKMRVPSVKDGGRIERVSTPPSPEPVRKMPPPIATPKFGKKDDPGDKALGGNYARDLDVDGDVWPLRCPECHLHLNPELSCEIRPGLLGRILQAGGKIALLASIAILFLCPNIVREITKIVTRNSGWNVLGLIIGPAFCLYAFSLFCPRVRTFTCWKCGWRRDYPEKMRVLSLGRGNRIKRLLRRRGPEPVRKIPGLAVADGGASSDDVDPEKPGKGI